MRLALFFLPLLLVAFEAAGDDNELDIAEPCDEETCKLPACRCSSTAIPGGLAPRDTPQFVLLTFDDNVNVVNIPTYREMVYQRKNKNGCPAGVTFFVSHEYTNYQHINELYNQGFEIALHSISHQSPQEYWANASYEILMREIADQRILMAHFANIPFESIQGVRLPFLQMSGNASFQMMASAGLKYDISWPTLRYVNPGLWPYTLDYASTQDCVVPPCPNASIPGPWVVPMVTWTDLEGFPCAMVDTCYAIPNLQDEEGWYRFILRNFERHYLGSRAPFGFYVHEWFLRINPAVKRAVVRFLDLVNNLHDAFMVNGNDVIDWVQNPVPVNEYAKQACKTFIPTSCRPSSCGPLFSQDTMMTYWMQLCNVCPRNYPWVNNPLGQ